MYDFISKLLIKLSNKIVVLLSILCLAYLTISCLFLTTIASVNDYTEKPHFIADHPFIQVLSVISILGILYIVHKIVQKYHLPQKLNFKKCLILTFFVYGVLMIIWIFISDSIPYDDSGSLVDCAISFSNGDYSSLDTGGYLHYYPFQLGMVLYLEILFRLFHSIRAIQLFNVINLLGSFYFFYQILRLTIKSKVAEWFFLILFVGCFNTFFYSVLIYGDISSLFFMSFAVWMTLLYFERNKLRYSLLAGLGITIACLLKSNNLISLIAFLILYILHSLKNKNIKPFLIIVFIVILTLFTPKLVEKHIATRSGIEIKVGIPKITWVAMGMQEGFIAPGWFNGFTSWTYENTGYSNEKMEEYSKDTIREFLRRIKYHPDWAVRFLNEKTLYQWTDPTYQCFQMTYRHGENSSTMTEKVYALDESINNMLYQYMNIYQSFIFLLSTFYLIKGRKFLTINQLLLIIIFLGGFIFHILWEAKSRYAWPYFLILIPYASGGICMLFDMIDKSRKRAAND